ncbi:hypothetical protein LOD99_5284 [Oopsacas minuta]|uniref:Reverse transcriptase n=1 Tax=Oopsacas minuta TaxID=111878 RepID=A0AAV7JR01_9METZ|nr:hypothetical protein LOD99_5284 [Oopsacas minuta]
MEEGRMRIVMDYRMLKPVRKRDEYSLPNPQSIFVKQGVSRFISSLDIASIYWTKLIAPGDDENTHFTICVGGSETVRSNRKGVERDHFHQAQNNLIDIVLLHGQDCGNHYPISGDITTGACTARLRASENDKLVPEKLLTATMSHTVKAYLSDYLTCQKAKRKSIERAAMREMRIGEGFPGEEILMEIVETTNRGLQIFPLHWLELIKGILFRIIRKVTEWRPGKAGDKMSPTGPPTREGSLQGLLNETPNSTLQRNSGACFTSLPVTAFTEAIDESSDLTYSSNSCNELLQISKAEPFTQGQLHDLVRDLGLSKDDSEVLASRLSEHHVLHSEAKITYYRRRDEELIRYFSEEGGFVFCNNISGLLSAMGVSKYNPNGGVYLSPALNGV